MGKTGIQSRGWTIIALVFMVVAVYLILCVNVDFNGEFKTVKEFTGRYTIDGKERTELVAKLLEGKSISSTSVKYANDVVRQHCGVFVDVLVCTHEVEFDILRPLRLLRIINSD